MTSRETVKVWGSLEFPFRVIKKWREIQLEGIAVVRVEAPPAVDKTRASIHLVVALALSSIATPKLLDPLKKAIKFIIQHLDDGDSLSIVASDTEGTKTNTHTTRISLTDRSLDVAHNTVDRLVASGHTSFRSVLKDAKDLANGSDKKHRGFIIFLSDGRDTMETNWDDANNEYPVHTFGLGQAHDPEQLFSIAKGSNGTYSSITKNLNTTIMEAFAVCLAGFKSVVASGTSVMIKTESSELIRNSKITRIECGGIRKEGSSNKKVLLGVLYAGEVKDLIIHFECTVKKTEGFQSIKLITATVNYKSARGKEMKPVTCTLEVKVCATSFAEGCTIEESTPFYMVMQQKIWLVVLDLMNKFLVESRNGSSTDQQGNHLLTKWKEFKETKIWKDAKRFGLDDLVRRVESEIDAMASRLNQGSGLGCTYSWLSSYEMQRATTSGLPASKFVTPEMEKMVREAREQMEKMVREAREQQVKKTTQWTFGLP